MNEHRERPTMGARPEETLRLVAQLPAPDDLTDRVHARVRQAMAAPAGANRGFWQLWTPARRMQFAGAGVLALALGRFGVERVSRPPAPARNCAGNSVAEWRQFWRREGGAGASHAEADSGSGQEAGCEEKAGSKPDQAGVND